MNGPVAKKTGLNAGHPPNADLIAAARALREEAGRLSFRPPVDCVYNPLDHAWKSHLAYVERFGGAPKKIIFLGMNPGPWGMVQTGIPFGDIGRVRDFLGIETGVERPEKEHTARPVLGFACPRSEVSGKRFWGLMKDRFATADAFFAEHFVVNYCPLAFMEESGRNRTPDKLPATETEPLFAACDRHLRRVVELLQPAWLVGVGGFAEQRARAALTGLPVEFGRVPHPSPANPAANRDWNGAATEAMRALGLWD